MTAGSLGKRDTIKLLGLCDKIVMKFTTDSANYDLLEDTNIHSAIMNFYTQAEYDLAIIDGLPLGLTVLVDSETQIKINGQSFYNDFLQDIVYEANNHFKSAVIKDNGISGTVEITILK
jgi:hypothetical protein